MPSISYIPLSACEGRLSNDEKDTIAQLVDHKYTHGDCDISLVSTERFCNDMLADGRISILEKMLIGYDYIDIGH
jgi:hypothetical protein